jgi:hypothetical protein
MTCALKYLSKMDNKVLGKKGGKRREQRTELF